MKEKADVPKFDKFFLDNYIPKLTYEDILKLIEILTACDKNKVV